MFHAVIDAPFGKVGVRLEDGTVREIVYLPVSVDNIAPTSPLALRAVEQIERYFERASATFDLPLAHVGTAFQRRVWDAICDIPPGNVLTYGQIARKIGSAPRAVGQACGSNYFPIVIPCHRVVGSNWIGGFAHQDGEGYLREVKRWLLTHEGVPYAGGGHMKQMGLAL
ncbi:cysteine methyltransferase [Paraburkholderia acidicola]|uniref:Cysteine methyltransferase n=1 Tax=Paraburkholderia acidicola TaxID=1912599 RepID=A0A2A4F6A2_9BURK|nr:methylated-DNA--[protein]-cysteine S-methyltransferase [Paraburkholderia acidicola]PCE28138.1 cysteine methyltransferase [Paraburkholderia acidicola]